MSGNVRRAWGYGAMALLTALAIGIDAASDAAAGEGAGAGAAAAASSTPPARAASSTSAASGALRIQRSAEGYVRDREPGTLRDILTLRLTHSEKRPPGGEAKAAAGVRSLSVQYGDDWVYDAGTDLLLDADRDGYYRYLRVHFDVDSIFDRTYVYARLYTSPDGESWDFYYETDDFLVTGTTPDDAYEVESELIDNYPPGSYDVLVEIYDADSGVLVDEFGPNESSAFSLLPLEDAASDGTAPPPVVVVPDEHGGGGSVSWAALLALAASARLRRARKAKKMPDRGRAISGDRQTS